jgi:hypothetical protein
MVESIWSILNSRYNDVDSWLDLKYMGTNLIQKLTHQLKNKPIATSNVSNENIYESLSSFDEKVNLKKQNRDEIKLNYCNFILFCFL